MSHNAQSSAAPSAQMGAGPVDAPQVDQRRWVLDLTATAVFLAVAIAGWWPSFGGPSYLVAAIGGGVLGIAIAALATWRRWGILVTAGLTLAAYVVFGAPLALPHTAIFGVIPTLDTLQQLALGIVVSWKQLLTTVAPVDAIDGHLLPPYLLALVFGVLTASLALRLRQAAWALIPAAVHLVLVIALGVPDPAVPVVQGLVFAAAATIWLSLHQLWSPQNAAVSLSDVDPSRASYMRTRRLLAGGAVLALAVGAAVVTLSLIHI